METTEIAKLWMAAKMGEHLWVYVGEKQLPAVCYVHNSNSGKHIVIEDSTEVYVCTKSFLSFAKKCEVLNITLIDKVNDERFAVLYIL